MQWYVAYWRDRALGRDGTRARSDKQVTEAEILAEKLKRIRGEVFDRREVFDTLMGANVRLGNALELLATRIGRELNLTGEDVKMVRDLTDEMRANYVRDCGEFIEVVEDGKPGKTAAA